MQRYDRTGMSPVWLSSFIQGKPSLLIPPRALVRHHLNRGYLDHSWGTCGSWKWGAINPQDIFRTLRKRVFDLQQAEKLKGAGLGKWPLSPTACIKLAKQGTSAGKALRYLKLLVSRWVLTPRKSGDLKKSEPIEFLDTPPQCQWGNLSPEANLVIEMVWQRNLRAPGKKTAKTSQERQTYPVLPQWFHQIRSVKKQSKTPSPHWWELRLDQLLDSKQVEEMSF